MEGRITTDLYFLVCLLSGVFSFLSEASATHYPTFAVAHASVSTSATPSVVTVKKEHKEHTLTGKSKQVSSSVTKRHPFVIVIDAGHGGKDAGATGPTGIHEKNVTLAVARKLAALVSAEPTMRSALVRTGDYYVDLSQRTTVARQKKAHLFISLHADAHDNPRVQGVSVFILSREEANHLTSQVKRKVSLQASVRAGSNILQELKRHFPVHHRDIQRAGFMVLKSIETPSILIEMAFISNPVEERKLAHPRRQEQIAHAIFRGIQRYFSENAAMSKDTR